MISRKVRGQSTLNQLEPPPLQDTRYMIDPKQHAVIFEQTYNLPDNRSDESIRFLGKYGNKASASGTTDSLSSSTSSASASIVDRSKRKIKSAVSAYSLSHLAGAAANKWQGLQFKKYAKNRNKNHKPDSTSSAKSTPSNSAKLSV